jgi:Mg-chelatase subunit ChlD
LLVLFGFVVEKDWVLLKDVVFVVDTSGLMVGGKLDQVKKVLHFCVENFNVGDCFEVLCFVIDLEPLFQNLITIDDTSQQKAQNFITRLKPLNNTTIHNSLQTALKLRSDSNERPFIIIFLTDNLPTINETNINHIITTTTNNTQTNTHIFYFNINTNMNTTSLSNTQSFSTTKPNKTSNKK